MKKINPLGIILIYLGMFLLLFGFQLILLVVGNFDLDNNLDLIRVSSISNIFFYGTSSILFIFLYLHFWKNSFREFLNDKKNFTYIILGVLALLATSVLVSFIYTQFGITDTSDNQESLNAMLDAGIFDQVSLVVFAVFLAPMVEEMVFRFGGFGLMKSFSVTHPVLIITLTSILFGLIHVSTGDFEQIFYYLAMGVVLGTLYYKSNNIIVPIGAHMLLNAFVTVTMFMA